MKSETIVHLRETFFGEKEIPLAERGELRATAFRYPTGVAAIRLENSRARLVLLPFQGQQIWSAEAGGRNMTMRSMFDEPRATRSYLENYGGFLLHCGATAMGVPTKDDSHPLHGELPNAPYGKAWLAAGEDERGEYIDLRGECDHAVAFTAHYAARPSVRLRVGSTLFPVSIEIENRKRSPMELMYLAHVNFRPVDGGRLVYTALRDPRHVRVRTSIPSHIRPPEGYAGFLEELKAHPERHEVLRPGLPFDPEVVFFIDYLADADGWAHSMQVHPDGSADYIRHRPEQLDHGVRWICRTADQDALGLCLPGTAEPEGYHAEKAKGHLRVLGPGAKVRFEMEAGRLEPAEAREMENRITGIVRR
jgi:hypothetical protein